MASHSPGGRNGRRPRGGGSRRRGGGNRSYQNAPPRAPVKKSLLQRIMDLFSGGAKPAARPVSRPEPMRSNGAAQQQQQPTARSSRKPESVEVTTPRLYVGNLSFDATE